MCLSPACWHPADPDSGGLERGVVQRHGVHLALRLPLFRSSYDFRELRALQFAGGHLGGGVPSGGMTPGWIALGCWKGLASEPLPVYSRVVSLSGQGDANRSYSDDDRSSCNFDEDDKQKDSPHLSGNYAL